MQDDCNFLGNKYNNNVLRGFDVSSHSLPLTLVILTISGVSLGSGRVHKINPHCVMVKVDFPACYTQTANCLLEMSFIISILFLFLFLSLCLHFDATDGKISVLCSV